MMMAAVLSQKLGWLTEDDVSRVEQILIAAKLPTTPPAEMDSEQFLSLMSVDKKVQDGKIRLVLMKGVGQAVITDDYSKGLLLETLESFRA
jgi:3-dehydroquinate synthase